MRVGSLTPRYGQSFAAHLIAPGFKMAAVAKPHLFMSRAAAIRLMRLAQQATCTRGFGAFAFVIHGPIPGMNASRLS
jgi:hypothetical protein